MKERIVRNSKKVTRVKIDRKQQFINQKLLWILIYLAKKKHALKKFILNGKLDNADDNTKKIGLMLMFGGKSQYGSRYPEFVNFILNKYGIELTNYNIPPSKVLQLIIKKLRNKSIGNFLMEVLCNIMDAALMGFTIGEILLNSSKEAKFLDENFLSKFIRNKKLSGFTANIVVDLDYYNINKASNFQTGLPPHKLEAYKAARAFQVVNAVWNLFTGRNIFKIDEQSYEPISAIIRNTQAIT